MAENMLALSLPNSFNGKHDYKNQIVLPYMENNQKIKKDCVDAPMEKVGLLNPQFSSPLNIEFSSLDLRKEVDRLKTYRDWRNEFLKKEDLAIIGFYYVGRTDKVKCFFCKITIDKWEPNDTPLNEHLKWSPTCPLLRSKSTANIAVDEGSLNRLLPTPHFDKCDSSSSNSNYISEDEGFDKDICCETELKDWDKNDIPIEFIEINKYIPNSNSIQPAQLSSSVQQRDTENENDLKDCKICYAKQADLAFIPCGHVYCRSCGFSMMKCPLCKEIINEKHKIFF